MTARRPNKKSYEHSGYSGGYTKRWQLKPESARHMLSIMNEISDPDARGNAFGSVIIADAGVDPEKNDPAIASIIIFPDKVVISSRPLNDQDRDIMGISTEVPHIQELEQRAVDNGIEIMSQHQTKGAIPTLVITDCKTVTNTMFNAKFLAMIPDHTLPTVRHAAGEDTSVAQRALHALADELCRFSRRSKKGGYELTLDRQALEEMIKTQVQNSPT